jgi:hypothetical protein
MEILILNEEIKQSFSELKQIDIATLSEQVAKSPENYVFILSTLEKIQWLELHRKIGEELMAINDHSKWWERLGQFTKENNGNICILISIVSSHPTIRRLFKIVVITHSTFGDCSVVFFAKLGQEQNRIQEVIQAILEFRAEQQNGILHLS